jgi:hypothetical protein
MHEVVPEKITKAQHRSDLKHPTRMSNYSMNQAPRKNRLIDWIDYRLPIFTFLRHELHEYPTLSQASVLK